MATQNYSTSINSLKVKLQRQLGAVRATEELIAGLEALSKQTTDAETAARSPRPVK